jgi:hypothetical protein
MVCWPGWRRGLDMIVIGSRARRIMIGAYWTLAVTLWGDLVASFAISSADLTPRQFVILWVMALGMLPQIALFAAVMTPAVMRGKWEKYPFTRALVLMESCAAISIVMKAAVLVTLLRFYARV